jgi:hypothetical protein
VRKVNIFPWLTPPWHPCVTFYGGESQQASVLYGPVNDMRITFDGGKRDLCLGEGDGDGDVDDGSGS